MGDALSEHCRLCAMDDIGMIDPMAAVSFMRSIRDCWDEFIDVK